MARVKNSRQHYLVLYIPWLLVEIPAFYSIYFLFSNYNASLRGLEKMLICPSPIILPLYGEGQWDANPSNIEVTLSFIHLGSNYSASLRGHEERLICPALLNFTIVQWRIVGHKPFNVNVTLFYYTLSSLPLRP